MTDQPDQPDHRDQPDAIDPIDRQTSVLIVGAGPTGLMLALQLARADVPFVLIDANVAPSITTKALIVQARTMEIYQRSGVSAQAMAQVELVEAATIHINGKTGVRLPLAQIGRGISPFARPMALTQDQNERILGDELRELGIRIHWLHKLVALNQTSDGVLATLQTGDNANDLTVTTQIAAQWVAGCDGAHSAVRHLCAIEFPGAPYEQVFYVADVHARGPATPGELHIYLWPDDFHFFFPMRSPAAGELRYRLIGIVPAMLRQVDDLNFDDLRDTVHSRLAGAFTVTKVNWFSPYRIHHRRASQFRSGRCFLLGDAAHIHSPAGGQGMNTGLQDAFNLGWKLALVCSGLANAALLDSYASERIPVAQRLLQTTDQMFAAITSTSTVARVLRMHVALLAARTVLRLPAAQRLFFRTVSQTGIEYRASELSHNEGPLPTAAPHAGDRMPWLQLNFDKEEKAADLYQRMTGVGFHLILWRQPAAATQALADFAQREHKLLTVLLIGDQAANETTLRTCGVRGPIALLIRPDGHIAYAGSTLTVAGLARYLQQRIGLTIT